MKNEPWQDELGRDPEDPTAYLQVGFEFLCWHGRLAELERMVGELSESPPGRAPATPDS